MTEKDLRRRYTETRKQIAVLEREIDAIEKPFRDQMAFATVEKRAALEKAELALELIKDHCPEFRGQCEFCDTDLFEGDLGHHFDHGACYLCADCAPTYADMLAQYTMRGLTAQDFELTPDEWAEMIEECRSQPPDKKVIYEL